MAPAEESFCGTPRGRQREIGFEIPIGHVIGRQMIEPEFCVALRHFQKFGAAGQGGDFAVTIQRPAQAAGPGAFRADALMRTGAEKGSGLQIEQAFLGGGAVGADDLVAGGAAMGRGDAEELRIAGFLGCIKNDRHVHHDVDEQRIGRNERAKILPFFHEPHGQRAAGLDENAIEPRIVGEFVPGQISVEKNEAQVVDFAIELAVFEQF